MANCPACSAPAHPVDRFCGRCGGGLAGIAPLDGAVARYCSGCGRSLQPDARFCRRCGARVPEVRERARSAAAPGGNGHGGGNGRGGSVAGASTSAETPTESIRIPEGRGFGSPRAPIGSATGTATIDGPSPAALQGPPASPVRVPAALREAAPTRRGGFPWGGTLALIGSLAVIISAILDWGGSFRATLPRDISATWLLEPSGLTSGPSLGVVLLLAGTLGALVSLIGMAAPGFTFLRRFVGLLTLMVPMAFAFRTLQLGEGTAITDLPSALGVGAMTAAAGALLELAAGRPRRA